MKKRLNMNNVLDLYWSDMYNEIKNGNISPDEFHQWLWDISDQSYRNGYNDGDRVNTGGV